MAGKNVDAIKESFTPTSIYPQVPGGENRIVYLSPKEAKKMKEAIETYHDVTQLLDKISLINIELIKAK